MKITNRKNMMLGLGLLGVTAGFGVANPTLAAPRNNDARQERRDDRDPRKDTKQETIPQKTRPQIQVQPQAGRPGVIAPRPNGNNHPDYNAPATNRPASNYSGDNRSGYNMGNNHPGNNGPVANHPGNNRPSYIVPGNNRPEWNNHPGYNIPVTNRPIIGRPGYSMPGYDRPGINNGQSFTGTVTRVRSDQEFDINIGGTTYNVYTDYNVQRGLSNGDIVRVYGTRIGTNDIRNASATLIRNR